MKKYFTGLMVFLLVLISVLSAETVEKKLLPSLKAAEQLNDQFFTSLVAGDIDTAFDLMKPYMPVEPEDLDNLKDITRKQYEVLDKVFGKSLGYKLVKCETAGENLARYYYLDLREKFPVRWVVLYYRPQVTWQPVILRWDIRVLDLF